ncbi:hypothetical protein DACRYDRAFT_23181 [Dacryopinax primogenitus]|uniref:Uncharacterized protein n=1 Tax=Dacryopinax primogenitus (strain DJM 731) TaxID=1858805 RepID=M5FWZ0_DACPD|nr:uncharacterized protein DACRYDRAFT_23181 [Dacryopinax primogenitus]EJU00200.1 hypothetical protein DACRYDRAFT_23181 [Dacryopinax primogenitus]
MDANLTMHLWNGHNTLGSLASTAKTLSFEVKTLPSDVEKETKRANAAELVESEHAKPSLPTYGSVDELEGNLKAATSSIDSSTLSHSQRAMVDSGSGVSQNVSQDDVMKTINSMREELRQALKELTAGLKEVKYELKQMRGESKDINGAVKDVQAQVKDLQEAALA